MALKTSQSFSFEHCTRISARLELSDLNKLGICYFRRKDERPGVRAKAVTRWHRRHSRNIPQVKLLSNY